MLADRPLPDLLDAFASSEPTPGGGSAAALMGALGASLLAMVAGLPKTKTGTDESRQALDDARQRLVGLQRHLTALVDRDAGAYDLVVEAFRKPKATAEEKAARTAAIQQAMQLATEVPLDTARTCAAVLDEGRVVAAHGNPSAKSDVGVALQALGAGMQSAWFNVEINIGSLKDQALVDRLVAEMRAITARTTESWTHIFRDAGLDELSSSTAARLGLGPTAR